MRYQRSLLSSVDSSIPSVLDSDTLKKILEFSKNKDIRSKTFQSTSITMELSIYILILVYKWR